MQPPSVAGLFMSMPVSSVAEKHALLGCPLKDILFIFLYKFLGCFCSMTVIPKQLLQKFC